MENKPKSLFASLLNQIQVKRELMHQAAVKDLYERNKITKVTPGYRLEESRFMQPDGVEVREYRLYQVIDGSVTRLRLTPESKINTGLESIEEKRR